MLAANVRALAWLRTRLSFHELLRPLTKTERATWDSKVNEPCEDALAASAPPTDHGQGCPRFEEVDVLFIAELMSNHTVPRPAGRVDGTTRP